MPIRLANNYTQLPARFYARVKPTPVTDPQWLAWNAPLAEHLALGLVQDKESLGIFSGIQLPSGVEPIATVYAGTQFGHLVPQLGDGRAILLGDAIGLDGLVYEIQLKGAGPTPYSRRGDGRAAIGPVIREYLVSEAMAALGVPTTRALCAIATGDPVYRQVCLPGAVLTRVARCHVRVGTFEFFAMRGDTDGLGKLIDFTVARLYPQVSSSTSGPLHLMTSVINAQAELVAKWMALGFVHGVMNTDNTSISGETIDYGPCAFLDAYAPNRTFSSIDAHGRYAYDQQASSALANLTRLAEALVLVLIANGVTQDLAVSSLQDLLLTFMPRYHAAYLRQFGFKLGLRDAKEADATMISDLLSLMAASRVDFTIAFARLTDVANGEPLELFTNLFKDASIVAWLESWRQRLAADDTVNNDWLQTMRRANPRVVPRNHRIEEAITAAIEDDLGPFKRLEARLARPFDDSPSDIDDLALPPGDEQWSYRTFCGT